MVDRVTRTRAETPERQATEATCRVEAPQDTVDGEARVPVVTEAPRALAGGGTLAARTLGGPRRSASPAGVRGAVAFPPGASPSRAGAAKRSTAAASRRIRAGVVRSVNR